MYSIDYFYNSRLFLATRMYSRQECAGRLLWFLILKSILVTSHELFTPNYVFPNTKHIYRSKIHSAVR